MRILVCKNNKIIAKPFIYSCCITNKQVDINKNIDKTAYVTRKKAIHG